MKIEQIMIETVMVQEKLEDVDGLSGEYPLIFNTDGNVWSIVFLGYTLLSSEDYNEAITLEHQIIEEMKDIQNYLNLVLKNK